MKKEWLHTKRNGFSVIEILLSGSIMLILTLFLVSSLLYGQENTQLAGHRSRATLFAQEGIDAIRNIRDHDYANLVNGTYGLTISANEWNVLGTSDTNGIFTRSITITDAGTDRKEITSSISWQQNEQRTATLNLVTYLSNWSKSVQSIGDWSIPTIQSTFDIAAKNNGQKIQSDGTYAYIIRDGSSSNFAIFNISNPGSPSLVSSLNIPKTLNNIAISGNYAYIASSDQNNELYIIDFSTPASPFVVGTYNTTGKEAANGIFVIGTTVYLTEKSDNTDHEFNIIDASTASSPILIGSLNLSNTANEIIVIGDYAYIATDDANKELVIIDISTPATPIEVASLNLSGNADADSITGFDSTIIIGKNDGNISIIDISTPITPFNITTFDATKAVNDLSLGNNNEYVFIATNENSSEFQVLDISDTSTPTLIGSLNLPGDVRGVVYDETLDRAFTARESNDYELTIIQPQ